MQIRRLSARRAVINSACTETFLPRGKAGGAPPQRKGKQQHSLNVLHLSDVMYSHIHYRARNMHSHMQKFTPENLIS